MAVLTKWATVAVSVQSAIGATVALSAITKANPGVVTTGSAHGYTTGDYVLMTVQGMYQLNYRVFRISAASGSVFTLEGEDTTNYGTFVATGSTVQKLTHGRSMATRRVTVSQDGRPLLVAMASFHDNPPGIEVMPPAPAVVAPLDTPRLQDWLRDPSPAQEGHVPGWVEHPPPVELRTGEPPTFLGGQGDPSTTRSHWMRVARPVGDDPVLHAALLTYASDYFLLDMVFRSYPDPVNQRRFTAFSLDHAIWFHRPVRFDRWHLHTQETLAITGHRGLTRGMIHDVDGHLAATVTQDVLARPASS